MKNIPLDILKIVERLEQHFAEQPKQERNDDRLGEICPDESPEQTTDSREAK